MSVEPVSNAASVATSSAGQADGGKLAFFRQSGWMVFAITAGGLFMYAVHIPAVAKMPEAEYGVFATLLQVLNLMLIPSIALQTVFTHQIAGAVTEEQRRQLRATVRAILFGTFLLWLAAVGVVFGFRHSLIAALKIHNPAALWITVLTGLPMLWRPIVEGLMQGSQNFLWLGWASILNGFGRFVVVVVTVVLLGTYAAGAMVGAFLGMVAALLVGFWQTRSIWSGPTRPFEGRSWLGRVVPLTLGLGAGQFMFAADMVVVQIFFKSETGLYGAAGTIARGIVIFTGPLVTVMFPKIVRSAARAEKTDVLAQALLATAFMAGMAALACTLLPELPFRILNKPSYLPVAPLLPWFAWCMLPLTLSNVLVNNLLARSHFRAVPWLVAIALAYGVALVILGKYFKTGDWLHDFRWVVQTLGIFNTALLAVAAWFTWAGKK